MRAGSSKRAAEVKQPLMLGLALLDTGHQVRGRCRRRGSYPLAGGRLRLLRLMGLMPLALLVTDSRVLAGTEGTKLAVTAPYGGRWLVSSHH
jgi:hypothetical protein